MTSMEELCRNEEQCVREAGSLGALLDQLPRRLPVELTDRQEWQQLLTQARALPVSMAEFPFGFEPPLHDDNPGADLDGMIMSETRSAAFFERTAMAEDSDVSIRAVVRRLA